MRNIISTRITKKLHFIWSWTNRKIGDLYDWKGCRNSILLQNSGESQVQLKINNQEDVISCRSKNTKRGELEALWKYWWMKK